MQFPVSNEIIIIIYRITIYTKFDLPNQRVSFADLDNPCTSTLKK